MEKLVSMPNVNVIVNFYKFIDGKVNLYQFLSLISYCFKQISFSF